MTNMTNKSYLAVLLLSIFLSANICKANNDGIKSFLFLSVFREESDSYYEQSTDIVKAFQSRYDHFTYECTKPIKVPVSIFLFHRDTIWDFEQYTIQLFKISESTLSPAYYILRISSCDTYKFSFPDDLWIRICGYRESDLKVFFDTLRKRGLKKKEITEMVDIWRGSDEMFREIDWDCLLKGYFKNDTHSSCYFSGANFWYKARYMGEENDIYAVFSKKILAGTLYKFD